MRKSSREKAKQTERELHNQIKYLMTQSESMPSSRPSQVLGGCLSEAKAGGFIHRTRHI